MLTHLHDLVHKIAGKSAIALTFCFFINAEAIVRRDDVPDVEYQQLGQSPQFAAAGGLFMLEKDNHFYLFSCTLINPRTILTAAHSDVSLKSISHCKSFWGSSFKQSTEWAFLSSYLKHPHYDPNNLTNDIALASLSERILTVEPAKLHSNPNDVNGETGYAVGFGTTGTGLIGGVFSDEKKRGMQNRIEFSSQPEHSFANYLTVFDSPWGCSYALANQFGISNRPFLLPFEGTIGDGDSGGPLYILTEQGNWEVVGISSFSYSPQVHHDDTYGSVAGFLRVADYIDWIQANSPLKSVFRSESGSWSDLSGWDGPYPPDNHVNPVTKQAAYYDAAICRPVAVRTDMDFSIDSLTLDHRDASLVIPPRSHPKAFDTHLINGTLQVEGAYSTHLILSGGMLRGNGKIIAIPNTGRAEGMKEFRNRRGTIQPGTPTESGTLTIIGDYIQEAEGTLQIKSFGPSLHDLLVVSNQALLDGTLDVIFHQPLSRGSKFTILSADRVCGEFACTNILGLSGILQADLSYSAAAVEVIVAAPAYQTIARTSDQQAVAEALDQINEEYFCALLDVLPRQALPAAFDALVPTLFDPLLSMRFAIDRSQRQWLKNQLFEMRLEALPCSDLWSTYLYGNVSSAQRNDSRKLKGFEFSSEGITGGANWQISNKLLCGISLEYMRGNEFICSQINDSTLNNFSATLYGSYSDGSWYVEGLIRKGWTHYDIKRSIVFSNFANSSQGKASSSDVGASLETGYEWKRNRSRLEIFYGIDYDQAHLHSYAETGANMTDLCIAGKSFDSLLFNGGIRGSHVFQGPFGKAVPYFSLSYQREVLQLKHTLMSHFVQAPATPFRITIDPLERNLFNFDTGFNLALTRQFEFTVDQGLTFGSNGFNAYRFNAAFSYRF